MRVFYAQLRSAQQRAKQGNIQQAIEQLAPLTSASGEKGLSANLHADLLRKQR